MMMLRGRDILLLVLAFAAIYQFSFKQFPWSVHLEPSWFIELSPGSCSESPSPMVEDIDGDGNREIVFVDQDCRLKAYRLESIGTESPGMYHPEELTLPSMTMV